MNTRLMIEKFRLLEKRPVSNPRAITAIREWLFDAHDIERVRINPYTISHQTGTKADEIIPELIHGVPIGLFDLHWDIRCPHCNMITNEYDDLSQAKAESFCPMCEQGFECDFANLVEVTFSLARDIENLDIPPPCPPPESLDAQFLMVIPYQQTQSAEEYVNAGTYRYVCPMSQAKGVLTVSNEKSNELQRFDVKQLVGPNFEPVTITADSGKIRFDVTNTGHPVSGFWVSELELPRMLPEEIPSRLSGLQIIHFPEFKEIFGDQVLSSRERMKIEAVTTMFTDITGSTQMYERLGDAIAYNIVKDHFEVLFRAIEAHGGSTLKTIGDAVMASFITNEQALECITEALTQFKKYNRDRNVYEKVNIKVGIHRGSAILVNLNQRLDYFGSTINKAARIQGQAASNEIAFSEGIYEDAACQRIFEKARIEKVIRQIVNLKGIEGDQPIYKAIIES